MGDMADMYDYLVDLDDWSDEDVVTCNRCGKRDLHWEQTANGWRLFHQSGRQHNCLNRPAKASEFEIVSAASTSQPADAEGAGPTT